MVIKSKSSDGDLFGAIFAILMAFPMTLWGAFVAYKIWEWFLVPEGLPQIGMLAAWGLKMATQTVNPGQQTNDDVTPMQNTIVSFLGYLLILGVAALVHAIAH